MLDIQISEKNRGLSSNAPRDEGNNQRDLIVAPEAMLETGRNRSSDERILDSIFKQYVEEKKKIGEDLPIRINHFGYQPDHQTIGIDLYNRFGVHVALRKLTAGNKLGETIRRLVAEQLARNSMTAPTIVQKRAGQIAELQIQQAYDAILQAWLVKLEKSGRKLKMMIASNGIDLIWIAEQTGIPYVHLTKGWSICARTIAAARKRIGLERYKSNPGMNLNERAYRQLSEFGSSRRAEQVKHTKNASAQVNNSRHTLFKFLKILGFDLDSKIGTEFGVGFIETLYHAGGTIDNKDTRKKFFCEMRKWQKFYEELLRTDGLPPDFPSALKLLIETKGYAYAEVERLCRKPGKKDGSLISRWINRRINPSIKSLSVIEKLERILEVPVGSLSSRIAFSSGSGIRAALRKFSFLKPGTTQYKQVAKHLPMNFPQLSADKQQMMVMELCAEADLRKSDYRKRQQQLTRKLYRLKQDAFPLALKIECENLIEFKTAIFPPAGYTRNGKFKGWKKPESGKIGTVGIFYGLVQSLFGVLNKPIDEGGMSIPIEDLSLTYLILPASWKCFLAFMEERHGAMPLHTADRFLGMVVSFIDPKDGWIAQSPWLAKRLRPVNGLLDEQQIAYAQTDWSAFIQTIKPVISDFHLHIRALAQNAPPTRDMHQAILPILESDEPLKFLSDALNVQQEAALNQFAAPVNRAIALRNIVLLRILTETGLRLHNLVSLTWNETNTAQLRRLDSGHYTIVIPHSEFKNSYSKFFGPPGRKYPYRVHLSKKLTPLLNEYLLQSRSYLTECWLKTKNIEPSVDDKVSLFISHPNGSNLRISSQATTEIVREFSLSHLVYNPVAQTGIKRVEPFSTHCVRHILATHILKQTGSYAAAAAAIQDSESTVRRYYARYLPLDRDKTIRHIITDLMEDEDR